MSIKRKIKLLLIIISISGLAVASAAFIFHDMVAIKKNTLENIKTLATVLEKDLGAALAFNDAETAKDTLLSLKTHKDVLKACLFTRDEIFFAGYNQSKNVTFPCALFKKSSDFSWRKKSFHIAKVIKFDKEEYGTLIILYSLKTIYSQLKLDIAITIAVLSFSFALVFVIAFFLEKFITTPILNLKKTASRISTDKNYSTRAVKRYSDEIGDLVDEFNNMLDEIQNRDTMLGKHNKLLEQRVNERTTLLQKRKQELENANLKLTAAVEKEKTMTDTAEQANKYKSLFLANMSHEIRTPMNAILGFTELLKASIKDDKDQEYLQSISNAGKTLLNLINEILDLSKIEAGKLELEYTPVKILSLFSEIQQIFSQTMLEKGLDFKIHVDPEMPGLLLIDDIRLRQILFNLIGNAIKFTKKGGIVIRTKADFKEDTSLIDLIITVEDTGIGIKPDQQKIIFEAFKQHINQSTTEYGGTGLGLTISKQLVALMDGAILLKSEPGKGSIFTIFFNDIKICRKKNNKPKKDSSQQYSIKFKGSNLLIVDDSHINRIVIKGFLQDENLLLTEAENGQEVLDLIAKTLPDLILMDMRMPVMDGYETTSILKEEAETKHIPIIAVTASAMEEDKNKALKAGCDQLLKKPINQSDLIGLLQEYLPHSKILIEQEEQKTNDDNNKHFAFNNKTSISDFLKLYDESMSARLEEINQTFLISDITNFADDIKDIAAKYEIGILISWAEDCLKQIDSFDVSKINNTIKTFPNLISRFRDIVEQN